ncbi:hypothetical protein VV38_00620 [Clavibacter nebraskensis]|nr:hypothetical protein VV38_00620 [Clavibacter nebraskensis]OAH18869.1 hypothetical protein A3Q38_10620 [Clavibacter nebraskensis]
MVVAVWLLAAAVAASPGIPAGGSARVAVGLGGVGVGAAVTLVALRGAGDVDVAWAAALAAVLIAGLSTGIQRFAVAHLRADPRQRWFVVGVNLLTASSVGVVLAPSVLWFAVAWSAAGASLLMLLAMQPGSRQARQGLARAAVQLGVGDLALWSAVVALAAWAGGDVSWDRIGAVAAALPAGPAMTVAVLLVAAGASRAAQVPFHGWLPMTLAAPTTVSAIMHAGVVNAAAFLVIRFAETVTAQPVAMLLLGILGAASMLCGAAGYLVRPDLKGRLVASTTAQMGVMLVALAVGAWGAALFHLIGHGIYKARLFLRAGDQIDDMRRAQAAPAAERASSPVRAAAVAAAVIVPGAGILAATWLADVPSTSSGVLLDAYGWMTAGLLLHGALTTRAASAGLRVLLLPAAAAAAAAYAVVVHAFDALVSSDVPAAAAPDPGWVVLVPLLLVGALSLLPRMRVAGSSRLYGWVTLLAGSPVPRVRSDAAPRPRPATSAPIIQELA